MKRGSIQGLSKFFGYPLLSRKRVKLRTSNLVSKFTGPIRIKAHKKFLIKGSMGVSRGCPIFWVPPIISGTAKATDFKFCRNIHWINRNKSPWKILGIVAVGVVRESRKFSGHPRTGRIVRSSLRYSFHMKFLTDFTYRNLHGFARFPGDSTALVLSLLPYPHTVYYLWNTHFSIGKPVSEQ